jgi:protoporphyrinogen oxidase
LWGIPCTELSADFAAQRIKNFSLGEAIKSAVGLKGKKHKTLVDEFCYPIHGSGMLYERMAQGVRDLGGSVHLRQPIRRMIHDDGHVTGLELVDGRVRQFDHVISTMPLTLLVQGIDDVPDPVRKAADALQFRNTILVYLRVESADLFRDQWLYIHSPELQVGRVTNFRNWVPELYGDSPDSILALEFWCYDEDGIWHAEDAELIEHATLEIRATGLVGAAPISAGHVHRIRRCYPVYASGYQEHLQKIVAYLQQFRGLQVIGRYGSFKYNNQDHSILMGILAAENLALGCSHDLWQVNTDTTYQEAAIVEASLPRERGSQGSGVRSQESPTHAAERLRDMVSEAPG